ncbi:hypothetical protein QQY24_31900 [Streptomyces sp. TG1A-8]|uniref:hypothetical protein n=1 Tax=Streptomyces sp. TG1A-8 TaxID=3051385 RepID=UPI00265BDC61|nr:hypothetical protein [Streptomyces sp. TG1A-8]MDO0929730.1 hypothetical protein [Streptomyces sp. TG1A-8]
MTRPHVTRTDPGHTPGRFCTVPTAGVAETAEEIGREDDAAGFEPEDAFRRVLAAINSHRTGRSARPVRPHRADPAAALGAHLLAAVHTQDAVIPAHRRAPRTLAQMRTRLAAVAIYEEDDDACGVCGFWQCRCGQARTSPAPARAHASAGGQCSECGGRFEGWPGGVCDACRAAGRG